MSIKDASMQTSFNPAAPDRLLMTAMKIQEPWKAPTGKFTKLWCSKFLRYCMVKNEVGFLVSQGFCLFVDFI